MQNITRTLTRFSIKALDVSIDENDQAKVEVIAQCTVESTSMNRAAARAALQEATGEKLPKGITIKWEQIGSITYGMPLDSFLAQATVIEQM